MTRWRSDGPNDNWPNPGPQRRTLVQWLKAIGDWLKRTFGGGDDGDGTRRGGFGRTGVWMRVGS